MYALAFLAILSLSAYFFGIQGILCFFAALGVLTLIALFKRSRANREQKKQRLQAFRAILNTAKTHQTPHRIRVSGIM